MTDNAELVLIRDALDLLTKKLAKVISNLSSFALKWKGEYIPFYPEFILLTMIQLSLLLPIPIYRLHSLLQ